MTQALTIPDDSSFERPEAAPLVAAQPSGFLPPDNWIDLDTAARRTGRKLRALQLDCKDKWAASGMAKLIGKKWFIAPELAPLKFSDDKPLDPRQFTDAQRKILIVRRRILKCWGKEVAAGCTRTEAARRACLHALELGIKVSTPTLYRWDAGWRQKDWKGLLDERSIRIRTVDEDAFYQEVKAKYLTPRRLNLAVCVELAELRAGSEGWDRKSYESCRRFIQRIPLAARLLARDGEDEFANRAEPYLERDYSTLESNQLWCADHHQLDVIVNNAGTLCRPWLTAWQDLRSRRIISYQVFAHDPNSDAIMACFMDGVLRDGVPKSVYIDNGKDFDCYALNGRTKADRWAKRRIRFTLDEQRAGVFPGLNIEVVHAWPYHGQSKPIERWFRTIEQDTPVWDTYCGRSTAHKPHDLQLNLERGKAPSLPEFVEWFGGVVKNYNAKGGHTGDSMDGKSPDRVYAECLTTKITAMKETLEFFCLRVTPPVKVTRNGVLYKGLRYGQYDLLQWLGKEVILRVDDKDLSAVQVWSIEGTFIASVEANQKMAWQPNSQELREAIGQKKRARRLAREWSEQRPRLHEDLPDLMLRSRAAANAADPQPPPPQPNIKPLRTAIDGELEKVKRAGVKTALRKTGTDDVPAMSWAEMSKTLANETQKKNAAEQAEAEQAWEARRLFREAFLKRDAERHLQEQRHE